jgi:hypothetical protein
MSAANPVNGKSCKGGRERRVAVISSRVHLIESNRGNGGCKWSDPGGKHLTSRYEKHALLEYAEARLARSESNVWKYLSRYSIVIFDIFSSSSGTITIVGKSFRGLDVAGTPADGGSGLGIARILEPPAGEDDTDGAAIFLRGRGGIGSFCVDEDTRRASSTSATGSDTAD